MYVCMHVPKVCVCVCVCVCVWVCVCVCVQWKSMFGSDIGQGVQMMQVCGGGGEAV